MSKQQNFAANLQRITGFRSIGIVSSDDDGYFLLAYCFRNGTRLSQWFSTQGSLDVIDSCFEGIKHLVKYNTYELGFDTELYTILFELSEDKTKAVRVISQVAFVPGDPNRYTEMYYDILTLADDLRPFNVNDRILN